MMSQVKAGIDTVEGLGSGWSVLENQSMSWRRGLHVQERCPDSPGECGGHIGGPPHVACWSPVKVRRMFAHGGGCGSDGKLLS